MKRQLCLVAAAALAVGTMGVNVYAQDAATDKNAAERAVDATGTAVKDAAHATGDAAKAAGNKTKDVLGIDKTASKSAEEINDLLAQVVEAAFTKDGLDDMAERFVDADRNRLGQNKEALDADSLDALVAGVQADWKGKYGREFDINDEDAVYNGFAMISEGEITKDSARQAGEKVEVKTDADSGSAKVEVKTDTGVDAPKPATDGQTAADKNLNDAGRNIANVTIAASHGMPEVKVALIHEATGWKIDIPDSVDSAKLRDNVSKALTKCQEKKDKWPADEKEAYRAATHKILLAISDMSLEAQTASDAHAPSATPAAPQ